jgi:UrcA family protein
MRVRISFLAVGLLAVSAAVLSQELGEIMVTATRIGHETVTKNVVGHSASTGAPIEHLTLTWSVAYSDLDLTKHSDAMELERRVHARAKAVCHELDRLYPLRPDDPPCEKTAVDGAMVQAQKAIASAGKTHGTPTVK